MDVLAYVSIVAAIIAVVGLWCADPISYSVRERVLRIAVASYERNLKKEISNNKKEKTKKKKKKGGKERWKQNG